MIIIISIKLCEFAPEQLYITYNTFGKEEIQKIQINKQINNM